MVRSASSLFLLIFLLSGLVFAQQQPSLSITAFGGVDNAKNPLQTEVGSADLSLNWDYSQTFDGIHKRDGCSLYVQRANVWLNGICAYIRDNGSKRLFVSANPTISGMDCLWNYIYFSPLNGTSLGTITGYYQYKGKTPHWCLYNNELIIANGQNRPVRFVDSIGSVQMVRPLTEVPVGHLDFAPVNVSGTRPVLNGNYYYAIRTSRPEQVGNVRAWRACADSMNLYNASWRINVDSDQVAIYNFPRMGAIYDDSGVIAVDSHYWHSWWHPTDSYLVIDTVFANTFFYPDSVSIQIGRTRANKTVSDSFFLIATNTYSNMNVGSVLDYIIDSTRDDSLGKTGHSFIGFVDTIIRTQHLDTDVGDTMPHDTTFKIGQVMWLGTDTIVDTAWTGMSKGMRRMDSVWKATHYCIVLRDTATGMVTDFGPAVRIPITSYADSADTGAYGRIYDYAIHLSIPPEHPNYRYLQRLLCRRRENQIMRTEKDTVFFGGYPAILNPKYEGKLGESPIFTGSPLDGKYLCLRDNGDTMSSLHSHSLLYYDKEDKCWMCRENPVVNDSNVLHTMLESWYVVDTLPPSDSEGIYYTAYQGIYVDSLPWSKISTSLRLMIPGYTHGQMDFPVVMRDRVYMASGNRVYYSEITQDGANIGLWYPENAFDVGKDDGDEITCLHVSGNELLIGKNNSIWTANYTEAGVHQARLMVSGVGIIASNSIVDIPGGGYAFLASNGIYSFSTALQSQYKETGGNLPMISTQIQNNLDKYTLAAKRECYSWLTPDKRNVVFSFPTLDTSWVYSIPTGQWNAWTFAARQGTYYTTTQQQDMRPMDTFIFIKNSDDYVFRYGGTKKDSGVSITSTWESQPLFVSNGKWGKINQYGLWRASNVSKPLTVTFYNQGDTSTAKTDSTQYKYRLMTVTPKEAMYYKVRLSSSADSLAIQKLDLWYEFSSDLGKK
ncbi:MAG: hypothetical protein WC356_03835 [Candidatus Micrarchaeia archaeon]|jgi:hypothetical protein